MLHGGREHANEVHTKYNMKIQMVCSHIDI